MLEYMILGVIIYVMFYNKVVNIGSQFDTMIIDISKKYGNDPYMIKAIIRKESGFNPKANLLTHNLKGSVKEDSRGLGQINTVNKTILKNLSIDISRLYDPAYNIECINKFVSDIKKRYSADLDIISAYNAGRVSKNKSGFYSNSEYVYAVYSFQQEFKKLSEMT